MMEKYINIVISGDIGTGKSSLGRSLAKKLGWKYEAISTFFRDYQRRNAIALVDWAAVPDPIKVEYDMRFRESIRTTPHVVFVGHYQGWNAKDCDNTFRILLKADTSVIAERIKHRVRNGIPDDLAAEEKRAVQLKDVFKKLYGDDDYLNPAYFHLVIDTTNLSTEETLEKAFTSFEEANH
jgi:cytidylate kinase